MQANSIENLFSEIKAKNLSNLGNELDIRVLEALRTQNRNDWKRTFPKYTILKMSKNS